MMEPTPQQFNTTQNTTKNQHPATFNNIRNNFGNENKVSDGRGTKILHKRELKKALIEIFGKNSKYDNCMRYASAGAGGVKIVKHEHNGFAWSGRNRCKDRGCVACGVIRELRNIEKTQAILHHNDIVNSQAMFLTLTQKRSKKSLADCLAIQSKMRTALNISLKKKPLWGFKGFITSVEYTYNLTEKSYQPHSHLMAFFDTDLIARKNPFKKVSQVLRDIGAYIKERWVKLAKKAGVYAVNSAQDVVVINKEDREDVGKYLHKFALELASGRTKQGRIVGNYTYPELLNKYLAEPSENLSNAIKRIAREIKYKRTFMISQSLKQYIDEKEDFEVEEKDIEEDVPLEVYTEVSKHNIQEHIIFLYNGQLAGKEDNQIMLRAFKDFCYIYNNNWGDKSTDILLKQFCREIQGVDLRKCVLKMN